MTTITRISAAIASTVAALAAATALGSAAAPKFFTDDPIRVERDTEDASGMKPLEIDLMVDMATSLATKSGGAAPPRAKNVNTIDEVPDSSWFTNRAGSHLLTAEDVARGPNTSSGPASGTWTITSSKSDGVTPGFTVKDSTGQRWFLKFDPPGYRAMATGTEVVVTKLMWALGYNVPENHIAYMRREQLTVAEGAKFTPAGRKPRAMRLADLDNLLERASREPDGSYRIVASMALPGKPIGRIRFVGTRPDDPNDIVPHEDRRELRGYGVFAAWLNHVDAKAINSLDTLVTGHGRSHVQHNLLDFGSALGSGGVGPADYWEGAEYVVEPREVAKRLVSFGFYLPRWRTMPFYEARAIGRLPLHSADFNPEQWRPRVPNPAFLNARADDRFWAAKKLAAITTDMIRAAVRSGEFADPAAEEFLVRALAGRRDVITRAYLTPVNPIEDLAIDTDGTLTFRNAAVDADVAAAPQGYRAQWFTYDNAAGIGKSLGETSGREPRLAIAPGLPQADGAFIQVALSAIGSTHAAWRTPVQAYFRLRGGSWNLVGLERTPEGN
jgi:hypothetical protein